MEKITIERAEVAWEANSEYIGEDIDSLQLVAGTIRMNYGQFLEAIQKLNNGEY